MGSVAQGFYVFCAGPERNKKAGPPVKCRDRGHKETPSAVLILSLMDSQVSFREAIAEELWQTGLKAREAGALIQSRHPAAAFLERTCGGSQPGLCRAYRRSILGAGRTHVFSRKPQKAALLLIGREVFGESALRCQWLGPRAGPQRFPPSPTGAGPTQTTTTVHTKIRTRCRLP